MSVPSTVTLVDVFPEDLQHLVGENQPLNEFLWLGIGGPARFLAEPVETGQISELVKAAKSHDLAVRILGHGSNILVREAGFDGLVISLSGPATTGLEISGNRLKAGAGVKLTHAAIKTVGEGLGGLEHLVGIPGSVGGAVVGNASAEGRDIGSVVRSIEVLDENGTAKTITAEEAGFSHRKSTLDGLVVLNVEFELEPKDVTALTKRMQKLWIHRGQRRPSDTSRIVMPFIDPDSMSTRDLIVNTGLSGLREGDVSLDLSAPQYLVAHENATSDQCLRLIERVREQVLLQTGIDLRLNLQIW
ncbi:MULTISPECIES: UDP-N-acetylmuramate dehydrogenase [Rhodopirellula]|uniref:UDP-N-acetylenolpyruvoylglucosamine reductase n=1 Tax=Rhodopirellula sallentina SM41 TaxID=1263870 RepID=M5UQA8_9BACT|nr:FAD-binding protein [Rhodopirellula sallentina]EMI58168.1 UDP-N-acetylenolpyruvoylglucosamine reductase [Rhodopirellula sallentina SM41]